MTERSSEISSGHIDVDGVFGPDGALARVIPGYEQRDQQVTMARAVAEAFTKQRRLIVEAATGTGKTLSYLVPAILSGDRTIVSTATKTLQEQIFHKDLPLLRDVIHDPFRAVYLKGRRNYACIWQWEHFATMPLFRRREDAPFWPRLQRWFAQTETGDRAELSELPDEFPTWQDLSISGDACLGKECAHYERCFVFKARREAEDADVIVVNHHLFFADLSIRSDHAQLLPDYDAIVFDEAHNLEETAASFFGVAVSDYRIKDLVGDIRRFLEREDALNDRVEAAIKVLEKRSRAFFRHVKRVLGEESRVTVEDLLEADPEGQLVALADDMQDALGSLKYSVKANAEAGEVAARLGDRASVVAQELAMILHRDAPDLAYIVEQRARAVFLIAYPIDLQRVFQEHLYRTTPTHIYTSATLTTDRGFDFFRARMGMPRDTDELQLPPVFDYMRQAVLYVPPHLPRPNDPSFVGAVADTMRALVEICDGRAFLLFTSYRNMRAVHELLAPQLTYTTLMQGEMGRNALLEAFRADTHSVLFATSSFWEGVDVQGEALSLVVIDKLPFASPFDPVVRARMDHLEAKGLNPFRDYQVPSAAITLKQGVGRLIRHREDVGVMAILDNRIVSSGYGKRFLEAIPRARRTQDIDLVRRWWAHKTGEA